MCKRSIAGWTLSMLLVVLPVMQAAAQQESPLKVQLSPVSLRPRSTAPIAAEVRFSWKGRQLLEGQLQVIFRCRGEVVGRYLSPELVINTGEQRIGFLFPPVKCDDSNAEIQAYMRFLTGSGSIDLGKAVLGYPMWMQRSLVICVGKTATGRTEQLHKVLSSMWLEHFNPDEASRSTRTLSTFPAYIEPEDFPSIPLGYCSYDMIFLPRGALCLLREKQLDALACWVEAGGSACIALGGQLKDYHAGFLNRLSGASEDKPEFSLDFEGKLVDGPVPVYKKPTSETEEGVKYLKFRPGLGRVVVVHEMPEEKEEFDSSWWRSAVAFLWKIRAPHCASITRNGVWAKTRDEYVGAGWSGGGSYEGYVRQFHVMPAPIGGDLLDTLIPKTISLVPFGLIVLMLVLFVLAIGPLDYFILGFLKRRKLTWIVFPALSIGFTLFTVLLSEKYMGGSDHRRAAVFVDLGRGGRTLRHNRFEVIFSARHTEIANEIKSGFFCPVRHARFRGYYGARWDFDEGDESGPLLYEGRIPDSFTARQKIRQWTPQLNRCFSMDPVQAGINLNWDVITPQNFRTPQGRERLKDIILGNQASDARICLFNGSETHHVCGERYVFPITVLRQCCVREPQGLFTIVSQISPTGADNFEDLTVLDTTDPRQWLVVVVVREGEDYLIYRRLYYEEEKEEIK